MSPATRGVGIRGGVSHHPDSGSGIRGRMDIRRCCVHSFLWSRRVWQRDCRRCSTDSGGGKEGQGNQPLCKKGICTEVISAQSETLVKFFLVSDLLIYVCMCFSSNLIAYYSLQQDTDIGLKESQASRGDEEVFVIIS